MKIILSPHGSSVIAGAVDLGAQPSPRLCAYLAQTADPEHQLNQDLRRALATARGDLILDCTSGATFKIRYGSGYYAIAALLVARRLRSHFGSQAATVEVEITAESSADLALLALARIKKQTTLKEVLFEGGQMLHRRL